jgi:DNA-binding XRE family transcriptional regulator
VRGIPPRPEQVTATQVRMARAALRLSKHKLARLAGVSPNTLKKMEDEHQLQHVWRDKLELVLLVFRRAGITFTTGNGKPPGVQVP